ncbi:MAG TPA: hypothetical protein VFB74_33545 [Kribbellaceae bacterium]|nr:hypothetical protein [Kribbellaceae bacterium]
MNSPNRTCGPYGSAGDLPSVVEMRRQLQAAKLITRVIARDQRQKLLDVERQLQEITELVDNFYALLGPRNWVFHERLSVASMKALVDLPVDEAERSLIASYKLPETLQFLVMSLHRFPELRVRMHLIERAKVDFLEGRYYSAVQLLLSVMDGFVNDFEPERRRGLHARDAAELAAWDSVVGHHMGLAHAHKTFTKTFKKIVTDEALELYRHGIEHGMVVNYDNDVVASKAWNRLFAVADWAASRHKRDVPPEQPPTWGDTLQLIAENARAKKALEAWKPTSLTPEDPEFAADPVVAFTNDYLKWWQLKNYGRMASLICPLVGESTTNKTAGMVNAEFKDSELSSFTVDGVNHEAAAVAKLDVRLTVNGEVKEACLRWIRTDNEGRAVTPNQTGSWGLMSWGLWAMLNERRSRAS